MGYIREPKGVNFVVEPHVVTDEDRRIVSKFIAEYKSTGKITRRAKPKRKAACTVKKEKR